jgi:hypothetical protein
MTRFATLIAAAASFAAAPAMAATYSATPATASSATRIIAHDISWGCGADGCRGSTTESRPAILCQGLAKQAGRLTSFVADGRAFAAAELDKCNASARGGASQSLAKAD